MNFKFEQYLFVNPRPKALLLSAGLGTRLKPWTDHHPKALAMVNGKSLLQRNIEYLQQYKIFEVVVNVHHFGDQIIDTIQSNNGWGSHITISDESNEVLETGGGLLKAAPLLEGSNPIVMMNVDILTDSDLGAMIHYHQDKKPLATLATSKRNTSRYLLFDEGNNLAGWKNIASGEEKLSAAFSGKLIPRAFSGIHIIEPAIFKFIQRTGKFSIIDVYLDLMSTQTIKSFEFTESRFIDVGKPDSIAKAELMFSL